MQKNSPFFTASVAAVAYFIILVLLQYFMEFKVDWKGTLPGVAGFWTVIFLVHIFLKKRHG